MKCRSREKDDDFDPSALSGCDAIEGLISTALGDSGAIVAYPSGPRSILVSAPRHLIRPYVAPVMETPCEQRKRNKITPGTRVPTGERIDTDAVLRSERENEKATPAKAAEADKTATAEKGGCCNQSNYRGQDCRCRKGPAADKKRSRGQNSCSESG